MAQQPPSSSSTSIHSDADIKKATIVKPVGKCNTKYGDRSTPVKNEFLYFTNHFLRGADSKYRAYWCEEKGFVLGFPGPPTGDDAETQSATRYDPKRKRPQTSPENTQKMENPVADPKRKRATPSPPLKGIDLNTQQEGSVADPKGKRTMASSGKPPRPEKVSDSRRNSIDLNRSLTPPENPQQAESTVAVPKGKRTKASPRKPENPRESSRQQKDSDSRRDGLHLTLSLTNPQLSTAATPGNTADPNGKRWKASSSKPSNPRKSSPPQKDSDSRRDGLHLTLSLPNPQLSTAATPENTQRGKDSVPDPNGKISKASSSKPSNPRKSSPPQKDSDSRRDGLHLTLSLPNPQLSTAATPGNTADPKGKRTKASSSKPANPRNSSPPQKDPDSRRDSIDLNLSDPKKKMTTASSGPPPGPSPPSSPDSKGDENDAEAQKKAKENAMVAKNHPMASSRPPPGPSPPSSPDSKGDKNDAEAQKKAKEKAETDSESEMGQPKGTVKELLPLLHKKIKLNLLLQGCCVYLIKNRPRREKSIARLELAKAAIKNVYSIFGVHLNFDYRVMQILSADEMMKYCRQAIKDPPLSLFHECDHFWIEFSESVRTELPVRTELQHRS